ncbi:MAG: hypothetical protein E7377_00330 [Clostridiales bacterium]|nr:hypothetical protein [Clostridiales bacterium]
MIYACQVCGAWFTSEQINKASQNRDAVITCTYCQSNNEFLNPNASRLTRGYSALEEGRFSDAINVLTMEIEESERKGMTPSPDAFLGLALARFGVRTIFDSTDAKRMGTPKLSCWEYNEMYFVDDVNFINAKRCLERQGGIPASDVKAEKDKLLHIQEHIDTLKDYYDENAQSKKKDFEYGVFIAFEDEGRNAGSWERIATQVKNNLPKMPVFMPPDKNLFDSDLQYEAKLLYALHHSKCMLVLVGDNPSTRLRDLYTWYYHNGHKYDGANGIPGKNLGFVFHNVNIAIKVPSGTVDKNSSFSTSDPDGYEQFVARWNNIIINKKKEPKETKGPVIGDPFTKGPKGDPDPIEQVYTILDEHHLAFGHYPQNLEKSLAVTQHFNQYERPDKTDARGWNILFRNHNGEPYTWYRDEDVNGEKYRAVYFTRFREKCSVRESKEKGILQKEHGYVLRTIYCFKFDPLIWDVEKINTDTSVAVLISDRGIDSQEYNNIEMDNGWECCSMHSWLNHEFYDNAFESYEKKVLCRFENGSDDKVFLMDREEDRIFVDRHNSIAGSDYYKCLGGMGDRCISNCWITDKSLDHNGEASVIYPTTRYSLDRVKVDLTSVAVLPKVIITLKSGDEKRFAKNEEK